MTATTSPKELVAAYRRTARSQASDLGRPTNRSAFPGLGIEPTGMIYAQNRGLAYQPISGLPSGLSAERLAQILTEPGYSTVVADAATFGRLQAMADALPMREPLSLSRRLRISRGLPLSVKLPVLTEALGRRYWLPTGLDETSLTTWARAFGSEAPTTAITMRILMEKASDGVRPAGLSYPSSIGRMEELEKKIMEQAVWGGMSSDVSIYGMLEGYSSKANGLRVMDPGLLELHVLDGQVTRLVPMNVTSTNFTAAVSTPFKLKEGRGLRLTDGDIVVRSDLDSLRYGEGELHAVVHMPAERNVRGRTIVHSAKDRLRPLYAAEDVFEGRGSILAKRRWLGDTVDPVRGREIPLDVVLAGAPVA